MQSMATNEEIAARRAKARRSAIILGLVAFAFYVAFIVMSVSRAWEGAHGLEWELPSPLPYHTWEEPPTAAVIARGAEH